MKKLYLEAKVHFYPLVWKKNTTFELKINFYPPVWGKNTIFWAKMKFLPTCAVVKSFVWRQKLRSCTFKNCTLYKVPKLTGYVALSLQRFNFKNMVEMRAFVLWISPEHLKSNKNSLTDLQLLIVIPNIWEASEKVPYVLSHCHTKRRTGAPFIWYDTDFSKKESKKNKIK